MDLEDILKSDEMHSISYSVLPKISKKRKGSLVMRFSLVQKIKMRFPILSRSMRTCKKLQQGIDFLWIDYRDDKMTSSHGEELERIEHDEDDIPLISWREGNTIYYVGKKIDKNRGDAGDSS